MKSVSRSRRFIACLLCVLTVVCLFPISHAEAAAVSTTKEANMSKYSGNETGATWYWPIIGYSSQKAAYSDITSSYGYRHDPTQKVDSIKYGNYHMGMDLSDKTKLKKGTPVYSVREGKVHFAGNEQGYGKYVIVDHGDGYFSLYGHLNSLKVKKGESVKLDTVIGTVGETGASQGVHLHLEIKYAPDKKYKNALNVNPCPPGYEKKGASLNTKAKGKGNGHPVGKGTINYEVKRPSSTTPASQYTISFNANGGTGAPGSQIKAHGQNLTLSSAKPTRDGYTFQGWATSSNGAVAYQAGATYSNNAAVILYAVWKANSSGGLTPITSKPATVGSGYTTSGAAVKTLQDALNKVNNAGLTVDGKYGNNTKNAIINYQKKKGLTADGICGSKTWEKLIADYNALIKYTVTFDANGGSGAPGNQTKTYGQNLTLSGTKPTRTGHAFQGWSTSSGGSVAYQPGSSYSNNAATTLYAVWKAESYTVSYNANGGSGAPGNHTKTYGQNLTLSSTRPTREGHTFQGWATSAGGSVAYQPGATYSNNAAVTLYAVWNVDTYTVSYNANGGSGAPANQTKTYGQNLTLSSTRPIRDGYTFQGWATSAGGAATYQPGSNYSDNAAVTLYAVWKETSSVKTYTISYKVPEGQVAPEPQIKTHGVNLKLTTFVPVAPKGHSFVGWLNYPAAIKGNEPIYGPGAFYYEDSSATLTAVFEPNKYRVSYEANGGSGVPGYQIKRYGNDISISQLVPEREGYTFQGWATSAGGTAVYQPGSTYSDNADVTLYAVWKQNGDAKRLPGDVNDDGKVSLLDLARLCKYLAGYNVNIHELNSDVNGDGKVSLLDLARLCKYLAGYDVVLK